MHLNTLPYHCCCLPPPPPSALWRHTPVLSPPLRCTGLSRSSALFMSPCLLVQPRSGVELWSQFVTHKIEMLSPKKGESQGCCWSLLRISSLIVCCLPFTPPPGSTSECPAPLRPSPALPPPLARQYPLRLELGRDRPPCSTSPTLSGSTTEVWRRIVVTICYS